VFTNAAAVGGFDAVVFITPAGGLAFIIAWLLLFISIPKSEERHSSKEDRSSE
jgi:uncharacterized membrane protein YgdD (TMEM256/DUF423 family)